MLARDGRVWRGPEEPDDRAAPTPTPPAIAAALRRGRGSKAGVPAMGMVLTLIVVVDEEHADDAMDGGPDGLPRAPRARRSA